MRTLLVLNRREVTVLVAGLVLGLLMGMVVVGTSDDLRESLFGSAADTGDGARADDEGEVTPADPEVYYLADLQQAQSWLASQDTAPDDDMQTAFAALTLLPVDPNFHEQFRVQLANIERVVPVFHSALAGQVSDSAAFETCMALHDNPTSAAPNLYLLVTVPGEAARDLTVPDGWQMLESNPRGSLYWQMLACQPEPPAAD